MSVHNFTIDKGAASVSLDIFAQNSTDGTALTGLAYNTANLTAFYRRGAAITAITLVTQTVSGAYASGGFVEISATSYEGGYRLDIPDAVLATGVDRASIVLRGAANMQPIFINIDLTDPVNVNNGVLDSNLVQMGGVAQSATDLKDFADAGYDPATNKVQGVVLVDTTTTNTDMRGTDGANTVAPDNASIAAILVDTADMQPKLGAPAADLSADLAAVKVDTAATVAKTNQLTFTKANELDGNIRSINGAAVVGDGNATPWDGA